MTWPYCQPQLESQSHLSSTDFLAELSDPGLPLIPIPLGKDKKHNFGTTKLNAAGAAMTVQPEYRQSERACSFQHLLVTHSVKDKHRNILTLLW